MAGRFLETYFTPKVLAAQQHYFGRAQNLPPQPERVFLVEVVSFDWNCPKYITPRYTAAEIEEAIAPLRARIAELEAQLNT
jgi:hypothetical protein